MDTDLSLLLRDMQQESALADIRRGEAAAARYGLRLSETQMAELAQRRWQALCDSGRVEFGDGVSGMLLQTFASSPYLHQSDYAETMLALQDLFYEFKNRCHDRLSDAELLNCLRRVFDGAAGGSTAYLAGLTAQQLYDAAHGGRDER